MPACYIYDFNSCFAHNSFQSDGVYELLNLIRQPGVQLDEKKMKKSFPSSPKDDFLTVAFFRFILAAFSDTANFDDVG